MSEPEVSPWRPIAEARVRADRWKVPIDVLAKRWMGGEGRDEFEFRRFVDCSWSDVNGIPSYSNVPSGWFPVAWMPVPKIPREYP